MFWKGGLTMNLSRLFELQNYLDSRIKKEHHLEGTDLFSKKVLALHVEIAELANETRCFKFWSKKESSGKNAILEEYVDGLHFILTLGLEKDFTDIKLYMTDEPTGSITEQFLNLYIDLNDFVVCSSKDHYLTLFVDFLCLGKNLGFSDADIECGYLRKNNINHKRQDEGY